MSKLSLFNDIFREPWMIEPQTAVAQKQVLRGLLMGLEFSQEEETEQEIIGNANNPNIPRGKGIDVVFLRGTMLRDDGPCGLVGTRTIANELLTADEKSGIIGHILFIDSGGGAANSVPDLAEAIEACQKPVVAFVDGYMCSAAMYAGSYCDYIMANREENKVGCIGTMIQLEDYPKEARDKSDGLMHVRVYADGAEEKNDEYELALQGDFKLIKERILNPHNERFKADIRKNREKVREDQLKGRTYEAKDAVGTLIDSIGNFNAAVDKVIELSNHNITTMKGHENLQSLDTCRDLQMVDGYVSLNGEQLAEIDNAIGAAKTEKALSETLNATVAEQLTEINELTQERDNLKAKADQVEAKEQEIADLTSERDNLKEDNAKKDARIKELEEALDKNPENDEKPMDAMHNGNTAKTNENHELSDEEAMDYARKVVKGEI